MPKKPKPAARSLDRDYRERLEAAKRASTLQLLFKAARLLNEEALARVAARPGRPALRPAHTSLFPHLDLEGTRIVDLAARVGVTKQAVSQLVAELEAMGVVTREPDPEDGRARRVVLTELGRAGFFDGLAVLGELERELEAELGARRLADLHATLARLVERAESGAGTPGE